MNGLRLFELLDQLVSPVDELVFFVQSLCRLRLYPLDPPRLQS